MSSEAWRRCYGSRRQFNSGIAHEQVRGLRGSILPLVGVAQARRLSTAFRQTLGPEPHRVRLQFIRFRPRMAWRNKDEYFKVFG